MARATVPRWAASSTGARRACRWSEADIQRDLERRRPGKSRHTTQRREPDEVKILSGVFEGLTTGTPIGLLIENVDQKSGDYRKIKDRFRPGHADYSYQQKYGIRDYRGGGPFIGARDSHARGRRAPLPASTCSCAWASRSAATCASSARWSSTWWISRRSMTIRSSVPIRRACPSSRPTWTPCARRATPSAHASTSWPRGVPAGLGEPVFDKLEADIAHAMMGINAVRAVELGAGFAVVAQKGTEHRDEITPAGFRRNASGGILGGISTGQDILVSMALKPTSSIRLPGDTVDEEGEPAEVVTTGRHDPCVGLRAAPIAEAMLAIVLMDHYLRHRGQNADVQAVTPPVEAGRAELIRAPGRGACSRGANAYPSRRSRLSPGPFQTHFSSTDQHAQQGFLSRSRRRRHRSGGRSHAPDPGGAQVPRQRTDSACQ